MNIAIVINKQNFEKWSVSYPSFILWLGQLQTKFNKVDLFIPVDCNDELFIQVMKNFNVYRYDKQQLIDGEYRLVVNWYNSIILMEYDFINEHLTNSVNYIVSKRYSSHPTFFYSSVEMYLTSDKSFFNKANVICDYIWTTLIF